MIGELLGNRYELLEKIGEGGMSIVYKARCNKLNRYVAVKILKHEFCDNEEIVKKFKIEATAIAALSDSNIVNVLDVGSQEEINYIVMEYVNGKTLKDVIKKFGALNYDTAITVAIQIARALDCAHKNGIIHRDVKPQNILVTDEGLVKVTDFGIAKSTASTTLTNTSTIMGSAHYFSPEQAKGDIVDTRTDLYSLGVVIYEMVTGKLPFQAESPVTIALKHIQEDVVPPKKVNSKVPESLNDLVVKLMNKEPKDRYQTAKDLIVDLQKIKEDPNANIIPVKTDNEALDEGHTIVMAAVNPNDLKSVKVEDDEFNDDYDDDYYDDYDEDDDYYEDDYDRKKKKNRNKLVFGIIGAIVAIIIVFLGAFFLFSGNSNNKNTKEMVKVPEIKGLTLEQAKVALEREGLSILEAGSKESEEEEGTIIEVHPTEGSQVEKGSKIRVITSEGSKKLVMLDFTESDVDTVKKFLSKNGITNFNIVEQYSSSIEEGYVIGTNPESGDEISKNTSVTIYVSLGKKTEYKTVPNVVGLTYDEAKAKLAAEGLVIEKKTVEVNDKTQDKLVQSQTNTGMSVEAGSTVIVYVGEYKEKEKTLNVDTIGLVPGQGKDAAVNAVKAAAKQAGITINVVTQLSGEETGSGNFIVVDWDKKGQNLKNGDTITITYEEKEVVTNPGTDEGTNQGDTTNNN